MRTYRLALIGFGNVGHCLARLLLDKRAELRERYALDWRLTGLATRRLGWLADPDGLPVEALLAGQAPTPATGRAADLASWLAAADPDVLFEVTSLDVETGQPAIDHLRAALEAGAHAITANKGAVVHAYPALRDLARSRGRHFRFEASFMGGAPIYSLFRETLPASRLERFRGILNSTTTIMIEALEQGASFEQAVARAQALGVTETDPSADVDGWDAAVKLVGLAQVLFESPLPLEAIERTGIRGLTPELIRAARAEGRVYRLVSRLERRPGGLTASVRPEQVAIGDPLAVGGATLLAHFELDVLPGLTITTHQPGPETTAYDLLADFIGIAGRERAGG